MPNFALPLPPTQDTGWHWQCDPAWGGQGAPSAGTSGTDPDPAALGLAVLRKQVGTQPWGTSREVHSHPPCQARSGAALNPAAFGAPPNSRTSSGQCQGSEHSGITTAPGLMHGKPPEMAGVSASPALFSGAGSWHFLPTLHPSGSLPTFAHSFPGNSTHGDERGEERPFCLGSSATHTPTHVPHGDATATMRSLHLPAVGEATSPTDSNGIGEGVLWHHPPATLQGLGGHGDTCQPRGGMVRREGDECPRMGSGWE